MWIIFSCLPFTGCENHVLSASRFYRYFIGRNDQSVNESVMIKRIDQQLKVNRILVDNLDLEAIDNPDLQVICSITWKLRPLSPVPFSIVWNS